MKAKRSFVVWVTLLILACVPLVFAQAPTRIFGPAGCASQSIYSTDGGIHWSNWPQQFAFGINYVTPTYAFGEWDFSNANLPTGSTITQVEFKFKVTKRGTGLPGANCSFKLYD